MNWSTRLRRWVRIRTPPVRDASTKPSAATVLPAPVACSNQKRLAALGSSGCSGSWTSSSSIGLLGPVLRLLLGLLLLGSSSPGMAGEASTGSATADAVAVAVGRALGLGEQRGQRARQRVDLVGVEHRAVDQRRLLTPSSRSRPSSSDQVRRHSIDGTWSPAVELGQRGVERHAAGGPGRERVRELLPFEHEGFAGELLHPVEVARTTEGTWPLRPLLWGQPRMARNLQ